MKTAGRYLLGCALAWGFVCQGWLYGQEALPPPEPAGNERAITLEDAVGTAMLNNPRLRAAFSRVEQARGQVVQAGLYPNPRHDPGNPQTLAGSSSVYATGLSQQVIVAGKMRLDITAARRALDEANLDLQRERFDVIGDVRRQFFAVLALQERVRVLRSVESTVRNALDATDQLFKAGQLAEVDVLFQRVELRRIEATRRSTEFNLSGALRQLASAIGIGNMQIDHVIGDLALSLPKFDEELVRQRLLVQNVQVNRARVEIARNRVLLRRAEVDPIPNPTVQGGYQYAASPVNNQAVVGLYFDVPIWNRNQGNIRSAQAGVSQSVAALGAVQNQVLSDLADALARYSAADQRDDEYRKFILPDAERSLKLVRQGFDVGQLDLLRLLQAQRDVFETNLELIQAEEERLRAAADIAELLQLERFP